MNASRHHRQPIARLAVAVDLMAEPITGVLRHRHGADKSFAGWVALVRAVELALEEERGHRNPLPSRSR
ncbi:hypothetical protein [Actinomadura latina]|uniref:Uncharacterized protein n=1 Tax=Actinomadura latina TaxID=163603 RepID=A0A846YX39_9ACTN|nr:hypothetical protein [Actinomadura latina]NKZ04267.1 hypothetical protein [Actinomadura latina]